MEAEVKEIAPVEGETKETPPETAEVKEEIAEVKQEVVPEPSVKDLLTKIEKMERRTQYLQRKLEKPAKAEPVEPQKVDLPKRPTLEQFETTQEYEDALFEWRDKITEIKSESTRREREITDALSSFNKKAEALRSEHDDFDEVIESPVFSPSMRIAILNSESGPQLAYYLGRPENWDLAEKIRNFPPERQIYEMGKLESQILVARQTKKVTSAPAPIKPVGMSGGGSEKDPSKMSIEEWMAWDKQRTIEKLKQKYGGG